MERSRVFSYVNLSSNVVLVRWLSHESNNLTAQTISKKGTTDEASFKK